MSDMLHFVQVMDSFFPIGAFTLSDGLETYVQKNIIKNKSDLDQYIEAWLYTAPYNDLGFAALADTNNMQMLDELCSAVKSSEEVRLGSMKLCKRFLKTILELNKEKYAKISEYYSSVLNGKCSGHYCIAVGLYIRDSEVDTVSALELYCYNRLSAIVNHTSKLVPLSQIDGQKSLFNAISHIREAVQKSQKVSIEELGINGFGFAMRQAQHEKLYSRLYIS